MGKIEKAIRWMEKRAKDDSHGYDQKYRWGEKGDYDCSAAVISAWQAAGVPVKDKGASYTGNMLFVFKNCGFKDVTEKVNLKTGSGLKRGDVLLNTSHHAAMYCGDGKEVEASINEKGKAVGGKPGDQTGREFWIRSYRNYPWTNVLRYREGGSAGEKSSAGNGKRASAGAGSASGRGSVSGSGGVSKKPKWMGRVTAKNLNVRSWAGTEYGKIISRPSLEKGKLVDVCDSVKDRKGVKWYYVRIDGSVYGFVCAKYVEKV